MEMFMKKLTTLLPFILIFVFISGSSSGFTIMLFHRWLRCCPRDSRAPRDERCQPERLWHPGDLLRPVPAGIRVLLAVRHARAEVGGPADADGHNQPDQPAAALRQQRSLPREVHAGLAADLRADQPDQLWRRRC